MSVDRFNLIEEKLDRILTNDLPHLKERLGRIETNLAWITKLTGVILAAVLMGLVKMFFIP